MRVGLIIYDGLDTVSGGYIYDRRLVTHLEGEGDAVEVFSLRRRSYARNLLDNVDGRLLRRLVRARLDVLLQDELNHPSLVWLNRRLRPRVSYPVVAIVHHLRASEQRPAWQNAFYAGVERTYLRSVDGCIYNSRTTRRDVEALLGKPRPSLVAVPGRSRLAGTLSPEAVRARAFQEGPLRLLFVGNLIPRKGLHTLVEALACLPRATWRLDVVGSRTVAPAYVRRIEALVARAGVGANVVLHGALPDEALRERMAKSHVLAVPSSYEGFGMVYLEGMAFGLPALATSAGAAAEVVTHGRDGVLVPAGSITVIASQTNQLAGNREWLAALSLAALDRNRHHPAWEDSMGAVRRFLQALTTRGTDV